MGKTEKVVVGRSPWDPQKQRIDNSKEERTIYKKVNGDGKSKDARMLKKQGCFLSIEKYEIVNSVN